MKILHFVPWIMSGGVEKRRLMLAKHLPRDEVEQRVVCLERKGPVGEELEALGVKVIVAGTHWQAHDLSAFRSGVKAVDEFQPDILHGAVFEGVIQAALVSLVRRRPKLILEEIGFPMDRSVRASAYAQLLFGRADACVGVSESVGQYLRQVLRLPEEKIRVITNGIEGFERISAAERREIRAGWEFSEDDVVVVSVGRMHEMPKRMADTVHAFAMLRKTHPTAGLILIGDGPDRPMLQELAKSLKVDHATRFLGYRRDAGRLMGGGDIFVSASMRESFGQAIVEAMLAGLPVVTTPVGGPSEIVVPHKTGFFVPVGNPEAICHAVLMLARDPSLRQAYGQAGQERAAQLYTAERYAREVYELYRRVA